MSQKPHFSLKDSSLVKEYYRVLKRVQEFFGDNVKATDWMLTENMNLGGLSPIQMIEAGRTKNLEKWIIAAIDENDEPIKPIGFKG